MRCKRIIIFLVLFIYFFNAYIPAYAYYNLIPEFICETGIKLYKEGRLEDALSEFKRALLVSPNYDLAQKYVVLIENSLAPKVYTGVEVSAASQVDKNVLINDALSKIEENYNKEDTDQDYVFVREPVVVKVKPIKKVIIETSEKTKVSLPSTKAAVVKEVEKLPMALIELNPEIKDLRAAIEIEKDQFLIIRGEQITRFVITDPAILKVEKISANELKVECMDYGYTYLHVWDSKDRWTIEFLGTPPKYAADNWQEQLRKEQEEASSFKLRYSMDWSSYESGKKLDELRQNSYSWSHWLTLNGQTPYGDIDSQAAVRSSKTTTDLTYFTLGLENGKIGDFNDFSIRGFDFTPNLSNLIISSPSLRGVKLNAYAFNKKLNYTTFWGREGGGKYAGLSPGLSKIRNSYLSGVNVNFSPVERQNYDLTVIRGWGRNRLTELNEYGYDFKFGQGFDKWRLNYEIANDSQEFAHLLTTTYSIPRFKMISEFRNTDKAFHTMTGGGWRAGETGVLTNLSYRPTEKLDISGRFDIFLDKLYPNPEHNDYWNEDVNLDANYSIDQLTNLRLDYSLQNELGRLSPIRTYSAGAGVYRTLDWFKRISTYVNYRHQESKHFTASSNDFINEKAIAGLRFNVIKDLYYYCSYEYNWLKSHGVEAFPNALETGIDWNHRLGQSPFYTNLRFMYRDEEDTVSPLSFMSGEDYIEGYLELTYRPTSVMELYCSARVRNIWAENPDASKRIEANFYSGLRYTWDTGVHWDPIGTVTGVIFKDYNYDGIKQKSEPGIEGIVVNVNNKKATSDLKGEYTFKDIKAKKVTVSVDTSSIPNGFVMTTPAANEISISQGRAVKVYFGLVSRTELTGIVYEDVNNNNEFDSNDKGVKAVTLVLEDGNKAITDNTGRYIFSKITVGKHTVKLDLNSLPTQYIPKVEIFKEVDISEGSSYLYNIPLSKQKE